MKIPYCPERLRECIAIANFRDENKDFHYRTEENDVLSFIKEQLLPKAKEVQGNQHYYDKALTIQGSFNGIVCSLCFDIDEHNNNVIELLFSLHLSPDGELTCEELEI